MHPSNSVGGSLDLRRESEATTHSQVGCNGAPKAGRVAGTAGICGSSRWRRVQLTKSVEEVVGQWDGTYRVGQDSEESLCGVSVDDVRKEKDAKRNDDHCGHVFVGSPSISRSL